MVLTGIFLCFKQRSFEGGLKSAFSHSASLVKSLFRCVEKKLH